MAVEEITVCATTMFEIIQELHNKIAERQIKILKMEVSGEYTTIIYQYSFI